MRVNRSERYPRYRAPSGDGEILCRPDRDYLLKLLENPGEDSNAESIVIAGKSLTTIRKEARGDLIAGAERYTQSYADVKGISSRAAPIIATGHQPGLVHPGVWLKNFATAKLAEQIGGLAVSLIIDSDLCRSNWMEVPTGSAADPRVQNVPFDVTQSQSPFEERQIADRDVWNSFGRRATESISTLVSHPLLEEWWPEVTKEIDEDNLGKALASARHRLELNWGSATLELPQSELCRTESFHRFAAHLLSQAIEFRAAYNSALGDYRRAHRLRNKAQPVPDLQERNDWVETPFWIWSRTDPSRRPLFVKQSKSELLLGDLNGFESSLPPSAALAIDALSSLEEQGIKLRTRALATTMYARLVLSDLFIHGIGGAKYDQVTDHICEQFFGLRPPQYATITGTLRLPIFHAAAEAEQMRELRQDLRELKYHPERVLDSGSIEEERLAEYQQLVAEKSRWVKTPKTHQNCAERHDAIVSSNRALRAFTANRVKQMEAKLETLERQLRINRILDSREYSFCLFPINKIRDFVLDFPPEMT